MKLFTKEILKALPKMNETSELSSEEIKVPLKLFNPCGSGTWYITEYDPERNEAYGYVTGLGYDELGYISITELESVKLRFGLKIERDMHWNMKTTLKEVMDGTKR